MEQAHESCNICVFLSQSDLRDEMMERLEALEDRLLHQMQETTINMANTTIMHQAVSTTSNTQEEPSSEVDSSMEQGTSGKY